MVIKAKHQLSSCCGQGLVVSYYHHVAVVRGWWSTIGGQLLSSSCCGQGLVVNYYHHLAVVRGWWSPIIIILLWSGVGGQLCTRSLEGPFRNAFGKNISCNQKPGYLLYIVDYITVLWGITSHDKDPYEQISIMERHREFCWRCSLESAGETPEMPKIAASACSRFMLHRWLMRKNG